MPVHETSLNILTAKKLKDIVGGWDDNSQVQINIIGPDIYLTAGKGLQYIFYNGLSSIKVGPVLGETNEISKDN